MSVKDSDFALRALKEVGVHADGCAAVKVIGRFGSRSGLRWSEGDLSVCNCRLGALIREAAESRERHLEPSLRKRS